MRPPTARSVGAWFGAVMQLDERESLRHLARAPVVVLAGEQVRLTPSIHAHRLVEHLPDARLPCIPTHLR